MNCTIEDKDDFTTGVLLAVIATVTGCAGLQLQRRAIRSKRCTRALWLVGVLAQLGSVALYYVCLTYASVIFVSPLLAVAVVVNLLMSSLHENVSLDTVMYTVTMAAGCGCMAAAAAVCTPAQNEVDPKAFVIYSIVWAVVTLLLGCLLTRALVVRNDRGYLRGVLPGVHAGLPIMGALLVSYASLMARAIILDDNRRQPLWLVVAVCTLFGIGCMSGAMVYFDAASVVPIFLNTLVLVNILGGGACFGEFRAFGQINIFLFALGALISIVGMFMMARTIHHYAPVPNPIKVQQAEEDEEQLQG
jgi:hypothetical protein